LSNAIADGHVCTDGHPGAFAESDPSAAFAESDPSAVPGSNEPAHFEPADITTDASTDNYFRPHSGTDNCFDRTLL
jgi:hypothetical protein